MGSFASILPCPLFLPLSTTPEITTARTRAPTKVWDRRQDKSDDVAPGRRGAAARILLEAAHAGEAFAVAKCRATADEDGHYGFAVAI
jgi:hypothetical protein